MQHRAPAIFIADLLGLDFLNSIATPVDTPVDWLDSGDGLLRVAGSGQACASARTGRVEGASDAR